ncbi:MAG: hypothetical protein OXM00_05270 [Paracoccaceae bacterium]|nr:hypothetical protein [Paracoccaceae bacterium]
MYLNETKIINTRRPAIPDVASTQDAPLLASTCAEPQERLRHGGGRDTIVLRKPPKSTGRHAPDALVPSWNTKDLS